MKQFIGTSKSGNLKEAVKGLSDPQLIILFVGEKEAFAQAVTELEQLYPNVPSIGCVGQSYGGTQVQEKGITVTGLCGNVKAIANVLTSVSTMPVKDIQKLENDVSKISGNGDNTVCIDLCSSNDECVLTTINSVLIKKKMQLTGGTVWEGLVSANGVVYEDSCAYALVRNEGGKVKVYKENLYLPTEKKHIVTKAEPDKNMICELDGQPAEKVYCRELNIAPESITDQTFMNPLGRYRGDDVYIISIKERTGNDTFSCFRRVNPKDVVNILQIGDHKEIVEDTIHNIQNDFSHISGVFSINCLFRYLYFQRNNYVDEYLASMNRLGAHSGLIGLGEHYNTQHTNQTMSCVVFE